MTSVILIETVLLSRREHSRTIQTTTIVSTEVSLLKQVMHVSKTVSYLSIKREWSHAQSGSWPEAPERKRRHCWHTLSRCAPPYVLLWGVLTESLHVRTKQFAATLPTAQRIRSNQAKHGPVGAVTCADEAETGLDATGKWWKQPYAWIWASIGPVWWNLSVPRGRFDGRNSLWWCPYGQVHRWWLH